MSHRPFESPPPYRPDEYKPSNYAPSRAMYGGEMQSQPAYSYYPEDEEIQHFYKWSSPPGIIRIMAILIVVMCVGIFACVASTLPWDMDMSRQNMGYGGGTGTGGGYGGYGGYGFGGSQMGIGFAYGGNYTDPRSAKGFILAMTAFCFIFALAVFIMSATRTHMSTTRKFYLIVLIISGILGGMMFIASIVFTIGVNPVAQASGSSFYNQIVSICSQFYTPALTGVYMDQYLYHYCVVEPQEAIAIVLGFLVVVAFAIIIFFGVKTRKKINRCGKMNILWRKNNFAEEGDPQVEEWVKNVSSPEAVPAMSEYSGKVNGSVMEYRSVNGVQSYPPPIPEEAFPVKNDTGLSPNGYSSSSDGTNKDFHKKHFSRPRRSSIDRYDTDYNTGAESGEELDDDDNDWDSEYPPITSNQQRQEYKKEFDTGLQDYKKMQGELDDIIKSLSQLDKELDALPEDSQAYKKAAGEYNRLKEIKASPSYQSKKKRCKQLKNKLNHIKKMVSDYDLNK